eukprot:2686844-Alexandrium_andersonii.AAC.1
MPDGPIACPSCGEAYRRDMTTLAPDGRLITRYNKVLVFHSDGEGRPYPRNSQGFLPHGQAIIYPIWWDRDVYGQAAAVFHDVLQDVRHKVSRIPAARLASLMQAEVLQYQFARILPGWFPMTENTRIAFQRRNEVLASAEPPWAQGCRWEWEQAANGFIGFDGADTLTETDVLLPDDLIRMWAFSEYFSFAQRAAVLAAARANARSESA